MAFQVGTQIKPELADADYSGFVNAANIRAQAMMNLGEQIGGAITKYQVNKQKKEEKEGLYKAILPYATQYSSSAEEADSIAKAFSKDPKIGAQILQFAGLEKDTESLNQAIAVNTDTAGNVDYSNVVRSYIELGGKDPNMVTGLLQGGSTAQRNLQAPKTFTTPNGQEVLASFDPVLNQVVEVGTNSPLPEGSVLTETDPGVRERDARVKSLVDTLGVSERQALGLVEGVMRIVQNPDTGEAVMVNMITRESEPVDFMEQPPEDPNRGISQAEDTDITPEQASTSLYNQALSSTGIFDSALVALQRVAGQAGIEVGGAPEIINARQSVNTAIQQLIRALSINPRFPVSEQSRIRQEINITPSTFNDPVTLKAKMRAVDASLRERMKDEQAASQDKTLPRDTRRAARQSANDIANFLDLLNVPDEEPADVEESDVPKGVNPNEWKYMTDQEKALWQN